jgi:hypothetical protein
MKKILAGLTSLLLCFQILPGTAFAQTTIQLGSGTLWATVMPINTDYYYSYTQSIYSRSEMIAAGAATAGTISKIRYKTINVMPSGTWNYWTVYMGNTTVDSFVVQTDWRPISEMTRVFQNGLPLINASQANSWVELTLDTPFHWNGSDNIVIAVDENTPNGNVQQNWAGYLPTTPPGYGRGLYYGTDFLNPDPAVPPAGQVSSNIPQIQFEFTPDGTLPVIFGPLSAKTTSAGLQVSWQTFSETNVAHFEVLASSDGKYFKPIGEVASKGLNGNSSDKLDYTFFLSISDLQGKIVFASIPVVFAISLLLILLNRRNKRWVTVPLIFVVIISGFSCRKDRQSQAPSGSAQLFVKIEQVDKDGTKSSSPIVKVQIDQ